MLLFKLILKKQRSSKIKICPVGCDVPIASMRYLRTGPMINTPALPPAVAIPVTSALRLTKYLQMTTSAGVYARHEPNPNTRPYVKYML